MPGTMTISQSETFSAPPIVMVVGPKYKFQTTEQEVSRDGERKWTVQAAVTYFGEFGMRPVSEVIEVTLTGGDDPALIVQPGAQVEFERLRVGISAPAQRPDRDGGSRVVGGKPFYMAAGVRPVNGNGRPAPAKGE